LTESEDDASTVDDKATFRSKRKDPATNNGHRQNVKRIKDEVTTNELENERLREFFENPESFPEVEIESITDEGSSIQQHQIDDPVSYFVLL
jgi:hypothetical protein